VSPVSSRLVTLVMSPSATAVSMRRSVSWANVVLGVWVTATPWLFYVTESNGAANWSSWSVGAVLVTLAILTMRKPVLWTNAIGVALGIWLIASPWVLGFGAATAANAVIVGLLVAGYSLWATRLDLARTQWSDVFARLDG